MSRLCTEHAFGARAGLIGGIQSMRAIYRARTPSQPASWRERAGVRSSDAHPGRRDSRRARRPRRARLRGDRQRQDRRVPAADSARADRQAARHDARARARAHARAGRADPRRPAAIWPCTRPSPAPRCSAASAWARRSTRSAAASTCIIATPGRLLDHLRVAVREARPARVPRARRGRPHARHGVPAGDPQDPASYLPASARRCSSARRCRRRFASWRARCSTTRCTIRHRAQVDAGRASRRPSIRCRRS